jgi:peroxiredoxin
MHDRVRIALARLAPTAAVRALGVVCVAASLAPSSAGAAPAGAAQREAPDFVLKSTDGRNLRLSEYRGEIVVLTFWASWCGACRAALGELNDLAARSPPHPTVLGVSLDADAGRAASVARSLGLGFPTLVDSRQSVARLYDVGQLPLTLLLDRNGVVRSQWSAAPAPPAELELAFSEIAE